MEKRHDGYNGLGKRQGDAEKRLELRSTVDMGRLEKTVGYRWLKKLAYNDQVVAAHTTKDHNPAAVDEPQQLHEQVGGDHATAKIHRDEEKPGQHLAAGQVDFAHHVGRRDQGQQIVKGAHHRIYDGIVVTGPYLLVFEHIGICFHCQAFGPQHHRAGRHLIGLGNRGNHDKIEWIEHNDDDK